jgi:hypothetical protein
VGSLLPGLARPLAVKPRRPQHRPRPPLPDLPRQRLQDRRLPGVPVSLPEGAACLVLGHEIADGFHKEFLLRPA